MSNLGQYEREIIISRLFFWKQPRNLLEWALPESPRNRELIFKEVHI